ncbi:APC membrane recruitment protein 3 isoform X2 [Herpailurus yagouaroundi]|uniref:APC membrane recruitment protein 3 isoform X2 n=1 Tax=Herpailurus yagouaroundi TaxID=1608482 RepID=UPI001AD61DF1|nr:APC membrane recruitment protein 3 isoform X2 [Puma yagouaroundi]
MELKRGKTFIKSSLQISHEKPPDPAATAPVREDAGPWSVSPGGQQRPYSERAPQMPFVPAVAKSIPRKRISLKRPKKCFRNLFHIRRNKTENLASLVTKRESLSSPGGPSEAGGQTDTGFFPFGEGLGPDGLCQDLSDSELLPDSSFDLCRALCEDVASLKSFDSLTGCGEIFADESSVPSLELNEGLESPTQVSQALENKVLRGPFQGSMEQLASPAQNEMSDFAKFWDSVNRSVRQQHSTLLGPWLGSPQGTDTDRPRLDTAGLAELPLCPCRDPHSGSKASSIDTGTPKSEQPESVSTSDEGYYDSFSPGLEEDKKEASSPGTPAAAFPRDSYSGDALYELFYDPSEGPVGPSLDDDLCVSESLSGPALGAPLSMCSFHVGAEENLAPTPGPDLLSQSFLQSSWKGKECLLKLCDTELAITMGIINWLRRSPELRTPPASAPGDTATSPRGQTEKLEAGSEKKSPGPVKLEVRGPGASDAGRTIVGSVPSRRELWAHSLTKGLLAGESKVLAGPEQVTSSLSRDPSLECVQVSGEGGTQSCYEGLFSPVGSATSATTDTCSKNKVSNLWPSSQEPRPPENLEYFRGSWRPGPGESTLDVEPTLTGCAAQVAALQIQPDCQPPTKQPPRQDMSSGLCRQPQTRGPEIQQKQPNSFPSVAVSCGLPSLGSPLHSSQDQRCPGHVLDLSQLRVEHTRMDAQSRASVEDQPL